MRQAAVGHPQPNKRLERMRAGTFVANSMRPNQAIHRMTPPARQLRVWTALDGGVLGAPFSMALNGAGTRDSTRRRARADVAVREG
jgi:hypothetical protein